MPVSTGLALTVSRSAVPGIANVWPPSSSKLLSRVSSDLRVAEDGGTVRLGSLLGEQGVGAVVVPSSLAPVIPGVQSPPTYDPPIGLTAMLRRQIDLKEVPGGGGYDSFMVAAPVDRQAGSGSHMPGWARDIVLVAQPLVWVLLFAVLIGWRRFSRWRTR
jgi:hypothetical protein